MLQSIEPVVSRSQKDRYSLIKNTLLDSINAVFDALERNLAKKTKEALEHMCFRSVETGFVFTSPSYLEKKYGVAKSTIYRALSVLIDGSILHKKNFSSKQHNGLGSGIYFFAAHPNFNRFESMFGESWGVNEKADEKAYEKAEIIDIPSETKAENDSDHSTNLLPNSYQRDLKDIDLQSNVSQNVVSSYFVKYVPKEINELYVNVFDFRLRSIWQKITQAFKTMKQSILQRSDLLSVGANICKRVYQVWKDHERSGHEMSIDEMCAFAYKSARETFYNSLATLKMEDYVTERNLATARASEVVVPNVSKQPVRKKPVIEMSQWFTDNQNNRVLKLEQLEEAKNKIPLIERDFINKNIYNNLESLKESVLSVLRSEYRLLDHHDLNSIDITYEKYTGQAHMIDDFLKTRLNGYMELALKLKHDVPVTTHANYDEDRPF